MVWKSVFVELGRVLYDVELLGARVHNDGKLLREELDGMTGRLPRRAVLRAECLIADEHI
jgi:hypothetical protein